MKQHPLNDTARLCHLRFGDGRDSDPAWTLAESFLLRRCLQGQDIMGWMLGISDTIGPRLSIPIRDPYGDVVSISYRALQDGVEPKFWHHSFTKTQYLYGLYEILKDQLDLQHVFLVESYFDVIHLCRLGHASVAMMGSCISIEQASLLSRYTDSVIYIPHRGVRDSTTVARVLSTVGCVGIKATAGYLPAELDDVAEAIERWPNQTQQWLQNLLRQDAEPEPYSTLEHALRWPANDQSLNGTRSPAM